MRPETSHQTRPADTTDRPMPSDAELAEAAVHQPAEGPPPGVGVAPVANAPAPPEPADSKVRARWHEVQLQFVDDPLAAARAAQELVSEAVDQVTTRKRELDRWRDTDGADTERLRTVVRGYRDLLDRLTGT